MVPFRCQRKYVEGSAIMTPGVVMRMQPIMDRRPDTGTIAVPRRIMDTRTGQLEA